MFENWIPSRRAAAQRNGPADGFADLSAGAPAGRPAAPARRPAEGEGTEPLLLEWLALGGLLAFAAWLLGVRGVWALLLHADPTGLTLIIVLIFAAATVWCGARSRALEAQRRLLRRHQGWAHDYWQALALTPQDTGAPMDILLEQTHGPHATAWWVNGIQLKLGLLGKVIGFSILALQIGQITNFDATQSQDLLRSLTTGLGVALLTTMVGLVGNILLGLQLTRLDRYADALVTDIQREGLHRRAALQGATSMGRADMDAAPMGASPTVNTPP